MQNGQVMNSPITFCAPCPRASSLQLRGPLRALVDRERRPQRAGDGISGNQPAQLLGRHRGQHEILDGEPVGNLAPGDPGDGRQRPDDGGVGGHRAHVAAERPVIVPGVAVLLGVRQTGKPGLEIGKYGHAGPATRRLAAQPSAPPRTSGPSARHQPRRWSIDVARATTMEHRRGYEGERAGQPGQQTAPVRPASRRHVSRTSRGPPLRSLPYRRVPSQCSAASPRAASSARPAASQVT